MDSAHTRRPGGFFWLFLLSTVLLFAISWLLGGATLGRARAGAPETLPIISPDDTPTDTPPTAPLPPITCVVIDAGHGGEDGGTSSAAGLVEKDVNLAVAFALRDFLEAAGIPTVMTRTEDKLLYDRTVDFHGRKKVLDLAARRTIAEATEGCLFVSIHMNAFPVEKYKGMQVWYGTADPRASAIAEAIQSGSAALMPDNHRKIKPAGSSIYLLDRLSCPAILVECGFLSNPGEAERLGDEAYRRAVAGIIGMGILRFTDTEAVAEKLPEATCQNP